MQVHVHLRSVFGLAVTAVEDDKEYVVMLIFPFVVIEFIFNK